MFYFFLFNKQNVIGTVGVNLMRKTSSNLFSKIVNNLDYKLRASKFSFKSPGSNLSLNTKDNTTVHRNSIS